MNSTPFVSKYDMSYMSNKWGAIYDGVDVSNEIYGMINVFWHVRGDPGKFCVIDAK